MYRGELDILQSVTTNGLEHAYADPRFQVVYAPPVRSSFLSFSGAASHRTDVHLRRAVAHATDRRRIQAQLFTNETAATGGFTPPGIPGHTPDIAPHFDPELARQSLRQSTHTGPLLISVHILGLMDSWSALFDGWRETLGIDIQVVRLQPNELDRFPEVSHGFLSNWVAAYPDVEYFLRQCFYSASASNIGRWSSPAFDALVERAVAQTNGATRLALFHEADKLLVQEECAVVPIVYGGSATLVQPWVHGWWDWGAPWLSFDALTVDERSPRYHGLDRKSKEGTDA